MVGSVIGVVAGEAAGLVVMVTGLIGQFAGNLVVYWLLSRAKEPGQLNTSLTLRDLSFVALGLVSQLVVALTMAPLTLHFFPDGVPPQEISEILGSSETSQATRLFLFAAAVVLAPVVEEIMFRGVLLKALLRRGEAFAIVVSSVVFAAVHLGGLQQDRFWQAAAVTIPPILILGIGLAILTTKTGRLGPAIFLHSGWNLLAAIVLLLPPELLEQVS